MSSAVNLKNVITAPRPAVMTTELADKLVQSWYSSGLVEQIEEHEIRGGIHFYYLRDGAYIKVSRRGVTRVMADGEVRPRAVFIAE